MKKAVKMALIMLVGAFILAGCSKDDKDYALANHTHTGTAYQTYITQENGITLYGVGQSFASGTYYGLRGEIEKTDAVLIYECVNVENSIATWIQWPYVGRGCSWVYAVSDDGVIDFAAYILDENQTFSQNIQLGTIKIVVIPHTITMSMKSKGIDLSKYEEVARYCNLPADDVASLNVANLE